MRRLGAILMILGANIAVASIAAAFWRASFECALKAAGETCPEGGMSLFIKLMTSAGGLIFWAAIIAGLLIFWRGKRLRAN